MQYSRSGLWPHILSACDIRAQVSVVELGADADRQSGGSLLSAQHQCAIAQMLMRLGGLCLMVCCEFNVRVVSYQ